MEMHEYNFVSVHTSVLDAVVSTQCFKEIIGKLKLWSFAKKSIHHIVEEENPDSNIPQPSTSDDVLLISQRVNERLQQREKGEVKP